MSGPLKASALAGHNSQTLRTLSADGGWLRPGWELCPAANYHASEVNWSHMAAPCLIYCSCNSACQQVSLRSLSVLMQQGLIKVKGGTPVAQPHTTVSYACKHEDDVPEASNLT